MAAVTPLCRPDRRRAGRPWNTANDAMLAERRRLLISDPARFEGAGPRCRGPRVAPHPPRRNKYVTVIIDLTPVAERRGPARLLDMVEGRSKAAFATWLAAPRHLARGAPTPGSRRPATWRDGIEVVAMDGFTGFKTAEVEAMPDAVTVMDPFGAVRLAGDALSRCRQRVQQDLHGHRGRRHAPLFRGPLRGSSPRSPLAGPGSLS